MRRLSWQILDQFGSMEDLASYSWLIRGEFNKILFDNKKNGIRSSSLCQISDFRSALDGYGLKDLMYKRETFAWDSTCEGEIFVQKMLDQFVGNVEWQRMFPTSAVHNLENSSLDRRLVKMTLGRLSMWVRNF